MAISKLSAGLGRLGWVLLATSSLAAAQESGGAGPPVDDGVPPPSPGGAAPPPQGQAPGQGGVVYVPYGMPAPGTDLNAGLPSSARPTSDASSSSDDFDLAPSGSGSGTVYGRPGAPAMLGGSKTITGRVTTQVPPIHTVRRGDTLWDLSSRYYGTPWSWPRLWSYNPHVQNPHWIYPGDQLRMREDATPEQAGLASRSLSGVGPGDGGGGAGGRPLSEGSIFLRSSGFIGDAEKDRWGEVVGAREDQMLLSEGNHVYMMMRPGVALRLGQVLTVYRSVRAPERVEGAREVPGEIVAVKGSVRIDQWNPETRIARGRIVESVDVIERGAAIGPVGRRFVVVAPKKNQTDLTARVLASLSPRVYMADHQMVFLDRGSDDGLAIGNRLLVVRRGDAWRSSLQSSTKMARERINQDVNERVDIETTPLKGDQEEFPEEVIAELRVLRTHEKSAVAVVTMAHREIVVGDRAVARKGY